ncbi:uncharacterized protein LOC124295275 [Neodiprion lecontei]|uniref:Uncharacterized protein LOC124295275 n=1 Tax=Neodiprion lecontei TaxID=441921 RepID=A0ABM3GK93_NEOLC|nr:uncharacterized protein LOC124295275 [Neodiprion lecontei]
MIYGVFHCLCTPLAYTWRLGGCIENSHIIVRWLDDFYESRLKHRHVTTTYFADLGKTKNVLFFFSYVSFIVGTRNKRRTASLVKPLPGEFAASNYATMVPQFSTLQESWAEKGLENSRMAQQTIETMNTRVKTTCDCIGISDTRLRDSSIHSFGEPRYLQQLAAVLKQQEWTIW